MVVAAEANIPRMLYCHHDRRGGGERLEIKGGDYAEGVSSAAKSIVDIRVSRRSCMNEASIGENHIEADYRVQGQAPHPRVEAETSVTRMTTNAYPWTFSMGQSPLRLVVNTQSHVTKSYTSTNLCYTTCTNSDLLKRFEVNDHGSILSATTKARV